MTQQEAYWQKRAALLMYDRMEGAEEISAEIAGIYRRAFDEIAEDLERLFGNYTLKYKLTDAEALKLLRAMKDPGDVKSLMRLLGRSGNPDAEMLGALLNTPAYRARMARLQELQDKISDISKNIYGQDLSAQRKWYTSLASDTYNHAIYSAQREVGFQFSFKHIDQNLVDAVMNSKWDGAGFSKRLWGNVDALTHDIREQLTLGLLTGKSEKKMAAVVSEKYATGAFESRRLIRTESCYLSNEIQMRAYDECGADRYQYIATLDTRTDEECGALDRKIFKVKDRKPGLNCPPMHPFCRCTTKIYIDDSTQAGLKRRARNPATGKNELVPASVSYTDWAKQNGLIAPDK